MLTNKTIKLINSLKLKKNRESEGLFIAEGEKIVQEFINSNLNVIEVFSVDKTLFPQSTVVSLKELARISNFKTPNKALSLIQLPKVKFKTEQLRGQITIALDAIKDPGNLGTIIRIADWFGIHNIICSVDCVDAYNAKVVQATMGSLSRVNVYYEYLPNILKNSTVKSYGAVLAGSSIYNGIDIKEGVIVFGNESKGIGEEVLNLLDYKITIPRIGQAESLNAGVSVGIICAEVFRKTH